jgi:hypothetical protein
MLRNKFEQKKENIKIFVMLKRWMFALGDGGLSWSLDVLRTHKEIYYRF